MLHEIVLDTVTWPLFTCALNIILSHVAAHVTHMRFYSSEEARHRSLKKSASSGLHSQSRDQVALHRHPTEFCAFSFSSQCPIAEMYWNITISREAPHDTEHTQVYPGIPWPVASSSFAWQCMIWDIVHDSQLEFVVPCPLFSAHKRRRTTPSIVLKSFNGTNLHMHRAHHNLGRSSR